MTTNESKRSRRSRLEKIYRTRAANMRLLIASFKTQEKLAAALGVSSGHITHIAGDAPTKMIGEESARDYEAKLGLHVHWLDTPH